MNLPAAVGGVADPSILGEQLERLGCQALVVLAASAADPDLATFVGDVHLGGAFLVLPRGGPGRLAYLSAMDREGAAASGCALLPPETLGVDELRRRGVGEAPLVAELVDRALAACDVPPGKLAVAGRPAAGVVVETARHLADRGWQLTPGNGLVRRLRKRKSAAQVATARHAAAAATAALRRVAELLAAATVREGSLWIEGERLKIARLRRAIAVELATHDVEQPEGNIVAAGREAAVPHARGDSERVLAAGEAIVVDLFPRAFLYADCTRTFCVGTPPPALAAAHALVRSTLEEAHRGAVAGAVGRELQRAACDAFEASGYPTQLSHPETTVGYVHGLGHGVGLELHELPSFRHDAGDDGRLEEGDLFTLEPGLYEPGAGWGVRLEDLCWLGPDGLETLTPLPYDLDPRAWG